MDIEKHFVERKKLLFSRYQKDAYLIRNFKFDNTFIVNQWISYNCDTLEQTFSIMCSNSKPLKNLSEPIVQIIVTFRTLRWKNLCIYINLTQCIIDLSQFYSSETIFDTFNWQNLYVDTSFSDKTDQV
jgi:hypothetical protein